MLRLDAAIARPAAAQHGQATRAQLRAIGLSDEAVDVRIEAGILRVVHPGVLHHTAVPFTADSRLMAAILAAGSTAAASHRSAATLHAFEGVRRVRPELTVLGTSLPIVGGVHIHRTDTLDPVDLTRVRGIPVTTAARTALDLGAVVPFEVLERALQVALISKRLDIRALVGVLDRLGRRGRRGTAALRALVRDCLPDERIASMLEHDLHQLVLQACTVKPELQHEFVCHDGRVVRFDMAWPDRRIAVEADGHRWHATRRQLEDDLARRRSVTASAWTLLSYGWGDVHDRRSTTLAQLRSLSI